MVAAWNRFELPDRALPFTPQMLVGVAGALLLMGFPRFAAGCIVAFKVMMRTVELRDITIDDVAVDLHHFHAFLRLRDTKAGGRAGIFESVVIEDPVTVRCVRLLCNGRSPGERLVGLSDSKMCSLLHRAAKLLEMESWGLRLYSLRRGGATWSFRECGSHEQVAQLGHWSNVRTCRRYIEDGAAQLAALRLLPWQSQQLEALADVFRKWASSGFSL